MDDSIALMFNNTLQKIFSQSSRKNIPLRDACKIAQDTIRDSPLFSKPPSNPPNQPHQYDIKEYEILGNNLFKPLKLACETKEPKIMTAALDCLDKTMSYGIIKPSLIDDSTPDKKKLMESIVNMIGTYFSFQDDNVQLQIIKALLTAVITPLCDVHDSCLMNAIRTSYNIYLVSTNKINSTAAKSALFQMVDCVLLRFESISQQRISHHNSNNLQQQQQQQPQPNPLSASSEEINSIYQTNLSDVILLFRAFCKLSTKEIPEGSLLDSHEMKSKILSLELLSRILENPFPSLKLSEKFINSSIKRYLSISLLTNGTSPHLPVFKLTLTLFLSLIIHFKEHLKEEIGLFFSKILLNVLSSSTCSAKQKWLILPVLYEICKNPQTIVDIFVNYDCDPERKDIFEKMVYELSRVAQGTITERSSSIDDMKFKTLGLECIVTIMKSLVDWSKELYDFKKEKNTLSSSANSTPRKSNPNLHHHTRTSSSSNNSTKDEDSDGSDNNTSKTPLEQGIRRFNLSPKRGIEYLIKSSLIKDNDIEDIANFLKSNSNLDPKRIGEYLSQNYSILYKYIESFNFKDKLIDVALRELISCFLLSSESSTIDKIVEKFAEKYYNDNSGVGSNSIFSNAESIYLLSYTIIILSTDLHNPSINTKLTHSEWIKMNSKINNRMDFDEKFLLDIYNRVNQEPFKIMSDSDISVVDSQERLLRFNRESDYIAKQCQELIKAKLSKKSIFYKARNIEHVRPMFLLSWCYVLSTLSVVLDDTKDKKVISLCLEGFSYAIRVSCVFYLNVERSSFITALSKFSLLDAIKDPSLKNIECVKTLLSIGITEGNYLQDSFTSILKSICILERFHLFDSSNDKDNNSSANSTSTTPPQQQIQYQSATATTTSTIELQLKKLMEDNPKDVFFDSIQIERIFTNSINLSDDSIVTFFRCLCEVSEDEISHYSRNYSLVKLVEAIEYNFKRIRLVFYNIWEIVVEHFTRVGCNSNIDIAQHSIDSLRQLAGKYLEKQELAHYNFQNEFLDPFENIMINNPSLQIKELIIRCICQLAITKAGNIKSGWKTILKVLNLGAQVQDENIVSLSYQGIEQLIATNFNLVKENYFINVINCLSSFSNEKVEYPDICIKSLDLLDQLVAKLNLDNGDSIGKLLLPILKGMSGLMNHNNEKVRNQSTNLFFKKLNENGQLFNTKTWEDIIKQIIVPIFSKVDISGAAGKRIEFDNTWKQTLPLALDHLIQVFHKFSDNLTPLYPSILVLLEPFICSPIETSCIIGCDYYYKFLSTCNNQFSNDFWNISISDSINRILNRLLISKLSMIQSTTPPLLSPTNSDLSSASSATSSATSSSTSNSTVSPTQPKFTKSLLSLKPFILMENESTLIGKEMFDNIIRYEKVEPFLSVHNWNISLLFIQKITKLFSDHVESMPMEFCIKLLKTTDMIYILSQRANSEVGFISFFGDNNAQGYECNALSCLLTILVDMYLVDPSNSKLQQRVTESDDILTRLSINILKDYSHLNPAIPQPSVVVDNPTPTSPNSSTNPTSPTTTSPPPTSHYSRIYNSGNKIIKIICQIINNFIRYSDAQFNKHINQIYQFVSDLSLHDNVDIRSCLLLLFSRYGKMRIPVVNVSQITQPPSIQLTPAATIHVNKKEVVPTIVQFDYKKNTMSVESFTETKDYNHSINQIIDHQHQLKEQTIKEEDEGQQQQPQQEEQQVEEDDVESHVDEVVFIEEEKDEDDDQVIIVEKEEQQQQEEQQDDDQVIIVEEEEQQQQEEQQQVPNIIVEDYENTIEEDEKSNNEQKLESIHSSNFSTDEHNSSTDDDFIPIVNGSSNTNSNDIDGGFIDINSNNNNNSNNTHTETTNDNVDNVVDDESVL
ncbi:hypothetical protein CYY_000067 [Polysphondylium violaceum]|uniref:SEC7 domain-containing protein n=1 Tax=Polysphondylium violaceum TaxID=133409 RepID=A0A8J4Q2N3_9MYCE|nr:hypothetical protein CYY_000067 [Polysphondylium violaceum]